MDQLVKYNSDDEMANNQPDSEAHKHSTSHVNLESEWENFEKMLAGGDEDSKPTDATPTAAQKTETGPPLAVTEDSKPSASNAVISNPYSYLSVYTDNQALGVAATGSSTAKDMERQLEEFLEKTAQAASAEAGRQSQDDDTAVAGDGSHSDSNHSHTESDSESGHSSHSRSPSTDKEPDQSKKSIAGKKTESDKTESLTEGKAAAIKRLDEMNPNRSRPSTTRSRRSGSRSRHSRSHRSRSRTRRSRSRSRRSRSRSRRSRSRSRNRRHRRRSGSRSKRRRHRRRSGSRHRRRSHRSRSPRRNRDRNSGRRRRSRRRHSRHRSNSRERRKELRKAQFAAAMQQQQQQQAAAPQRSEDFKAKMKRELQQAARDAMAGKGQATPQQALLQTMAAMHAKAQELTGVEVPKFYNPAAINPLKFAEQQQKRKLLWSKAAQNKEQSLQKFQGTEVISDEKYRKLMGIKGEVEVSDMSEEQKQKQSDLFNKLDQEYAFARITTHTHRGMGLGVVSSMAAQSANEQFNKP